MRGWTQVVANGTGGRLRKVMAGTMVRMERGASVSSGIACLEELEGRRGFAARRRVELDEELVGRAEQANTSENSFVARLTLQKRLGIVRGCRAISTEAAG
jgi:hypothetical protein